MASSSSSSSLFNYFRSWMDKLMRDKTNALETEQYEAKIKEFMEFFRRNPQVMKTNKYLCPCMDMDRRRGTCRSVNELSLYGLDVGLQNLVFTWRNKRNGTLW